MLIMVILIMIVIIMMMNREFTMRDWGSQPASFGEGGEWDLRSGRDWGEVSIVVFLMIRCIGCDDQNNYLDDEI